MIFPVHLFIIGKNNETWPFLLLYSNFYATHSSCKCEQFYRVYCVLGDGESAEGSVWEALHFASHYNLDNLCVLFDVNRLGQSEPTSLQHDMEVYRKRLDAFGFNALVVDGHDVEELCKVYCNYSKFIFQ
jgi:transketolase N-terminal domain/subunit